MDLKKLNKKLDELLKMQVRKPVPLSVNEACEYLKCSKSTLYKLTSERLIPHYKPSGQKMYFDIVDLENYVYSNRIDTLNNIRNNLK